MQNSIVTLSEDVYIGFVSSGTVLVDCFATWCGPCERMLKILPKLADELTGKVLFAKVDVDENKSLCDALEVENVPTFILYKDGVEVERWDGIKTLLEMNKIISSHL